MNSVIIPDKNILAKEKRNILRKTINENKELVTMMRPRWISVRVWDSLVSSINIIFYKSLYNYYINYYLTVFKLISELLKDVKDKIGMYVAVAFYYVISMEYHDDPFHLRNIMEDMFKSRYDYYEIKRLACSNIKILFNKNIKLAVAC